MHQLVGAKSKARVWVLFAAALHVWQKRPAKKPQEMLHEGNCSKNTFAGVLLMVFLQALRSSHISIYTNVILVQHYLIAIVSLAGGTGDNVSSFCSSVLALQFHFAFSNLLLAWTEGICSPPPFTAQKLPFHQGMTDCFLHGYHSFFPSVQGYWKFLSSLPTPLFHTITYYHSRRCTCSVSAFPISLSHLVTVPVALLASETLNNALVLV